MLLPIGVTIAINYVNPGYFDPLLNDPVGKQILFMAVFLQLVGSYIIHRMTSFKLT